VDLKLCTLAGVCITYRDIQVQLRFCLLETSCQQQDKFPSGIGVRINNKPAQLPVCSWLIYAQHMQCRPLYWPTSLAWCKLGMAIGRMSSCFGVPQISCAGGRMVSAATLLGIAAAVQCCTAADLQGALVCS